MVLRFFHCIVAHTIMNSKILVKFSNLIRFTFTRFTSSSSFNASNGGWSWWSGARFYSAARTILSSSLHSFSFRSSFQLVQRCWYLRKVFKLNSTAARFTGARCLRSPRVVVAIVSASSIFMCSRFSLCMCVRVCVCVRATEKVCVCAIWFVC